MSARRASRKIGWSKSGNSLAQSGGWKALPISSIAFKRQKRRLHRIACLFMACCRATLCSPRLSWCTAFGDCCLPIKTPAGVEPALNCFAGSRQAVWLQRQSVARRRRGRRDLSVSKSSRRGRRHQKQPDFRQHFLKRLPLPHGQRSLRPSFSSRSLSPWTVRTPRFTLVSDGNPLRRLLIVSKKCAIVEIVATHRTPPFNLECFELNELLVCRVQTSVTTYGFTRAAAIIGAASPPRYLVTAYGSSHAILSCLQRVH